MKIIRTIESFYPHVSGPANQAYQISHRLQKHGITSQIYTSDYKSDNRPKTETYFGVPVSRFETLLRFMKYCYTPRMKNELRNTDFDLVHAHNYRNYQADVAFKEAKKKNKPFIINTHGALLGYESYLKGWKTWPYRLYDWITDVRIVEEADKVIVSTQHEYEEAIRFGVNEEKIEVIPMGFDPTIFDSVPRERVDNDIVLLFVGRISRNRNLEPIIRAMEYFNYDNFKVKLRIVGDEENSSNVLKKGYLQELKQLAASIRSADITFTGAKYGQELLKEYVNADIFVYTSLNENFGQTILEAAAAGLPLITTKVGVAKDIIDHCKSGFFVDNTSHLGLMGCNDKMGVVDAVQKLHDKDTRLQMGQLNKQKVEQLFNWDRIVQRYIDIYDEVQDEKNHKTNSDGSHEEIESVPGKTIYIG